jgi:hypothetical protein
MIIKKMDSKQEEISELEALLKGRLTSRQGTKGTFMQSVLGSMERRSASGMGKWDLHKNITFFE